MLVHLLAQVHYYGQDLSPQLDAYHVMSTHLLAPVSSPQCMGIKTNVSCTSALRSGLLPFMSTSRTIRGMNCCPPLLHSLSHEYGDVVRDLGVG